MSDTEQLASLGNAPHEVLAFVRQIQEQYGLGPTHDRRAHQRHRLNLPVEVIPLDGTLALAGPPISAVTTNISGGGLAVRCEQPIEAEFIEIRIAQTEVEAVDLLAHVRHCTPDGESFQIGARFVVDWSRWKISDGPP